jgi:hypothetical protein
MEYSPRIIVSAEQNIQAGRATVEEKVYDPHVRHKWKVVNLWVRGMVIVLINEGDPSRKKLGFVNVTSSI